MIEAIKLRKEAAAKKIAEITGEDPDSMPGAENDKPVEVPKEDPEVNDGSMGPKSSRDVEGAGDDRKITAGDLFEADEAVVVPEKKPLETDDANAKEAAANNQANDILRMIHESQTKKAAAPVKPAPEPAKAQKAEPSKKEASLNLELSTDILAKLACAMLAEEEGANLAERVLAKQAGQEKAAEVMDYLAGQEAAAREYIAGQQAAVAALTKRAQELGASDADAAIAAMAAESPEAVAAPAEAAPAPEAPAEGGDMLPEDAVAQVLLSQLASGDLTEEDLGEIVAELAAEEPEVAEELGLDLGVDEAGAEDAGAPPSSETEAEPTEEKAAPEEEEEKAASAKKEAAAKKKPAKAKANISKKAELMTKVAQAAKLLTVHLKK